MNSKPRRPRSTKHIATVSGLHAVGLFIAAIYIVPMLYVVVVSVTPDGQRPGSMPKTLSFVNYVHAYVSSDFVLFFLNSAAVALTATVLQIVLSCSAGYALAMLPVKGKQAIMILLVALLVVPPEVLIVPLFVIALHVPLVGGNDLLGAGGQGLLDSIPGLILPHIVSALGVFLMRQFYAALPLELGNAARVDGAGEMQIFARIYTPLVKPAVAIVGVFAFQAAWNDFIWPLVTIHSNSMRTLQLGLTVFFQENGTQWNLLMAAVLSISVPVILLFLLIQRFFKSGALTGALK